MKKVLSLIVALIMVLSLTACRGNSASESESSAPTSSTEEPESSSTAEESEPEEDCLLYTSDAADEPLV